MMRKVPVFDQADLDKIDSRKIDSKNASQDPAQSLVAALQDRIRSLEGSRPVDPDEASLDSGCAALNRLLPTGGFPRGSLIEWIAGDGGSSNKLSPNDTATSTGTGTGAGTLAMIAARQACLEGGALVVMDRRRLFYPPAAAALGVDLDNVIVIRARDEQEELWALDQALRCEGVAAVWASLDRIDEIGFRRLQLAAENGSGLGLLVRPAQARFQPSWSLAQLVIHPQPSRRGRRLRLAIARYHGPGNPNPTGQEIDLEIDEVTGAVRSVEDASPQKPAANPHAAEDASPVRPFPTIHPFPVRVRPAPFTEPAANAEHSSRLATG